MVDWPPYCSADVVLLNRCMNRSYKSSIGGGPVSPLWKCSDEIFNMAAILKIQDYFLLGTTRYKVPEYEGAVSTWCSVLKE